MKNDQRESRFWARVVPVGDCLEYPGHVVCGTPRVRWAGRAVLVHRLVYEWNHGEIPEGMVVLRSCDNSRCVNPRHLRLGTRLDATIRGAQTKTGKRPAMSSHLSWEPQSVEPDPIKRFWAKVKKADGCWEWTATKSKGRGMYGWKGRMWIASRVAWEIVNGEIPKGLYVCHTCDNPGCVNPDHLFLGTHNDNMRDKAEKGRVVSQRGSDNKRAKLSTADIPVIRMRYDSGESLTSIAADFGVVPSAIRLIGIRRNWAHIPE